MKTTEENISFDNTQDCGQDRNRPAVPPFMNWDVDQVQNGLRSRHYQGRITRSESEERTNPLLRGGR